jgi:hypothetical protein
VMCSRSLCVWSSLTGKTWVLPFGRWTALRARIIAFTCLCFEASSPIRLLTFMAFWWPHLSSRPSIITIRFSASEFRSPTLIEFQSSPSRAAASAKSRESLWAFWRAFKSSMSPIFVRRSCSARFFAIASGVHSWGRSGSNSNVSLNDVNSSNNKGS